MMVKDDPHSMALSALASIRQRSKRAFSLIFLCGAFLGCAATSKTKSSAWRADTDQKPVVHAKVLEGEVQSNGSEPVQTAELNRDSEPLSGQAPSPRPQPAIRQPSGPGLDGLSKIPGPVAPVEASPAPTAIGAQRRDLHARTQAPLLGLEALKARSRREAQLIFDFPVTYNSKVRKWIRYFQTTGRPSFRKWLERSSRYGPFIQAELRKAGLPLDLLYVAMIESGFSASAASHANAIGLWQFIVPTGERYGLKYDWWIDERRDYEKSTRAAIGYMKDLFDQFGSWYLVTASYNMGENGVRRLIQRYRTNSYWDLAERGALPEETRNYVPKMLAAMLIAKAPALYGFRDLSRVSPFSYDAIEVPGGTDLSNLARYLGVTERTLTELNPELIRGFIPREVTRHRIRIPKGARLAVSQYVAMTSQDSQVK